MTAEAARPISAALRETVEAVATGDNEETAPKAKIPTRDRGPAHGGKLRLAAEAALAR